MKKQSRHPRWILNTFVAIFLLSPVAVVAEVTFSAVTPPNPSPLDTVRIELGRFERCTAIQVESISQANNKITISAKRAGNLLCFTEPSYVESVTLGRLPAGNYVVELRITEHDAQVGSFGPVNFSVGALPPASTLLPRENFTGAWSNPAEPGYALTIQQSNGVLAGILSAHTAAANPTDGGAPAWYLLQPAGGWQRTDSGGLMYQFSVLKTQVRPGSGIFAFNPTLSTVGTASFVILDYSTCRLDYQIDGTSGFKQMKRMVF